MGAAITVLALLSFASIVHAETPAAQASAPVAVAGSPASLSSPPGTLAQTSPTPTSAARVDAPERAHDSGKIDQGTKVQHTFRIKNVGTDALSLNARPG